MEELTAQTLKSNLDLRNLLLISLILGIAVFIISQPKYSLMLLLFTLILLLYLGKLTRFFHFAFFSVLLAGGFFATNFMQPTIAKDLLGFLLIFMLKFLPLFIVASVITHDLPTSQIIGGFSKLHVPKPLLLSLVVALRYIPTIRQETGFILQSMKSRGIGFSLKNIIRKPLRTIEYVLIPLLFRSLTIAEELAATAITRGIENPQKRTCYLRVQFSARDYLVLIYFVIVILALIYLDNL